MKSIWKTLMFVLAFLQTLASAALFYTPNGTPISVLDNGATYQLVEVATPTGLLYKVWQIIGGVIQAHADELSLYDQIKNYHIVMGEYFGINPDETMATNECESMWKEFPDKAIVIWGDWGNSYSIAQFQWKTFDKWKKEAGMPELKYDQWQDQLKLQAWAWKQGKTYRRAWTCWRNINGS